MERAGAKAMSVLEIRNETRCVLPSRSTFVKIAKEVLPGWEISLVFVGSAKAKKLNESLRDKNYIPNVLSYVVGKKSGEIIICPQEAKKQASSYDLSSADFIILLFIHGLLHVKGWAHGVTMEKWEQKLLAKFSRKYGAKNSHRH